MNTQQASAANKTAPTLSSGSPGQQQGFASTTANGSNQQALDGRLAWLDLNTRATTVHRALQHLFSVAMQETNDAARVGNFLLSLWSPSQYHLDLNELGFLERETNFAVRHLANFIVACQLNFREIVTYSQMAPVIAAWGGKQE